VLFAEDHPMTEGVLPAVRNFKFASPGYFSSMGIAMVSGRDMTWTDLYNFRPVAVISENLAREYWHSPSAALGKRIREGWKSEWSEVIGVVADERNEGVEKPAPKTIYRPMMMQHFWNNETFLRRDMAPAMRSSRTGSATLPEQVRQAVRYSDGAGRAAAGGERSVYAARAGAGGSGRGLWAGCCGGPHPADVITAVRRGRGGFDDLQFCGRRADRGSAGGQLYSGAPGGFSRSHGDSAVRVACATGRHLRAVPTSRRRSRRLRFCLATSDPGEWSDR
jgi:hypothetical protein